MPALLSAIDFGADHKRAQVIAALDDQNFVRAAELAREAIRRDPLNGGAPSLLGTALLAANQLAAADAAFRVAGQMGWRDAGVQSYWLLQALGAQDYDIAAQRLDALLRVHRPSDFTAQGLTTLENSAAGRAALARRLAYSPDWANWYLHTLLSRKSPEMERRSAVLIAAARQGLSLPPQDIDAVLRHLVADGHYDLARKIGLAFGVQAAKAAGSGVVDGDFTAAIDASKDTAFGWRYYQTGNTSVSQAADAPGDLLSALRVSSSASTAQLVARQILSLAPGPHILRWRAVDHTGAPSAALTIELTCRDSSKPLVRPQRFGAPRLSATFEVPSSGCASQELKILTNPPLAGGTMNAWISHVALADR